MSLNVVGHQTQGHLNVPLTKAGCFQNVVVLAFLASRQLLYILLHALFTLPSITLR